MLFYIINKQGQYLSPLGQWVPDSRHASAIHAEAVHPIIKTLYLMGCPAFGILIDFAPSESAEAAA